MQLITTFAIAVGVAMDVFAVSLGIGTSGKARSPRSVFRVAFHCGLFQGLMTFLGWLAGSTIASLITAVYGLGQIMGPPMVAWLLARGGQAQGFAQGLALAAGALVAGAAMYAASAWRWPLVR